MKQVGESAWLLTFDDEDEPLANLRARAARNELLKREPEGLVEAVPAARTLLVVGTPAFEPAALEGLDRVEVGAAVGNPTVHEIRVRFDGEDVTVVLATSRLSRDAFEKTFLETCFTVGFLGFLPGFAYLYGLPKALHVPRRASPRLAVPPYALAVAGPYAAIYPSKSPGGWNLIGTALPPWPLFEPARERPNLFSPGDEVRFVPA
jgi:KipI family sensor histidine kinase inhibitor